VRHITSAFTRAYDLSIGENRPKKFCRGNYFFTFFAGETICSVKNASALLSVPTGQDTGAPTTHHIRCELRMFHAASINLTGQLNNGNRVLLLRSEASPRRRAKIQIPKMSIFKTRPAYRSVVSLNVLAIRIMSCSEIEQETVPRILEQSIAEPA
jgi:hypothetical protein